MLRNEILLNHAFNKKKSTIDYYHIIRRNHKYNNTRYSRKHNLNIKQKNETNTISSEVAGDTTLT